MRLWRKGEQSAPASQLDFDFDAPGSRFTMRLAVALVVPEKWSIESERRSGVAPIAITDEFGSEWLAKDPDLGAAKAVNGSQGRGASSWIPVVEWLGNAVGEGVIGLLAGEGVRRGVKRVREKLKNAHDDGRGVMVSRGLAASLAMEHVFETTDETEVLNVEFAQEPSILGGRPPSETSYTGLEPWIVSLVNGSRKIRYVLVVSPAGDVQGCIVAKAGEFDWMYGLLPPVE